ncbi:hypothetical protein [Clostridium transplantifaecale]|uniref:hypothetical protein n=1 Tax=Clostridium transplantifaecale TaxID=2479838 RepID=UPI000F63F698|nr:hypothetical protein [Clostridium transplantifaecale]
MRNEDAAVRPGTGMVRGIDEFFVPGVRVSRAGNPGRKSSCGKRSRSLEYITDTNLEKTSVSADELPGSLRNLFLPSSPQEGYDRDERLSQDSCPVPGLRRLICPFSSMEEALVAATTLLWMPENYILYTMILCKLIIL